MLKRALALILVATLLVTAMPLPLMAQSSHIVIKSTSGHAQWHHEKPDKWLNIGRELKTFEINTCVRTDRQSQIQMVLDGDCTITVTERSALRLSAIAAEDGKTHYAFKAVGKITGTFSSRFLASNTVTFDMPVGHATFPGTNPPQATVFTVMSPSARELRVAANPGSVNVQGLKHFIGTVTFNPANGQTVDKMNHSFWVRNNENGNLVHVLMYENTEMAMHNYRTSRDDTSLDKKLEHIHVNEHVIIYGRPQNAPVGYLAMGPIASDLQAQGVMETWMADTIFLPDGLIVNGEDFMHGEFTPAMDPGVTAVNQTVVLNAGNLVGSLLAGTQLVPLGFTQVFVTADGWLPSILGAAAAALIINELQPGPPAPAGVPPSPPVIIPNASP